MNILFQTRKLRKSLSEADASQKAYGAAMAKVVRMRMQVLAVARNLGEVPA